MQRIRALAFGALWLASSACSEPTPAAAEIEPPLVTVQVLQPREVTEWDEYLGRFEAVKTVEIRSRVEGYLQEICFVDGQVVDQGDLLFVIDPRPFEARRAFSAASVAEATSDLELRRNDLQRAQRVAKSAGAISEEEVDSRQQAVFAAEARLRSAEATQRSAELDVEFTQVRSPIAGRIGRHQASVGNLVRADDTLLTTVVSLDPIHCYFAADERAYLRYARLSRAGERPSSREHANPVRVALADETDFAHEGKMDFVDNAFDDATGTIQGRAILPNPDGLLAPGLFASVRLLGRSGYRALQIPDTAIATNQSQRFVFVVEGGRAVYRPITTGRLIDGLRVVDSGLREGDRVVVRGHQRLREGDAVRVQVEDPAATSERAR